MIVYHGSNHVIEVPEFNGSKKTNDYGYGFYTTESLELAKEWACADNRDGFANCYEFDTDNLTIINLQDDEFHILNWLAILLENRTFNIDDATPKAVKTYILENFLPDYKKTDVMIGYRADDSYFSFARAFVQGTISLQTLDQAMHLGKLGEQIVLCSELSFTKLNFLSAEDALWQKYYNSKIDRDTFARRSYFELQGKELIATDTFAIDIVRGGWKNDDPRLRQIIR